MGAPYKAVVAAASGGRLKREDYRRTKHDSAFSHWKILIGPSDWEYHSQGKEGAEKYRIQNLPNCTSCSGVYELGIAKSRSRSGREVGKLDPNFIIPVYLGKADNVRNRLQQYGREGAHLENCSSYCNSDDSGNILAQKGPGLFSEIFSKGYSVVYRWAPMKSSWDAQKTEADLLARFDYAWNKGSNGHRRPNDILKRIDCSSKKSQFLSKFQLFPQRRKGIKIIACEPPFLENGHDSLQPSNLLYRILKFGRSQPRLVVPWRSDMNEHCPSVCGVALGHGIVCRRSPAEGRKRCVEHKGMKVNGFTSRLHIEGKFMSAVDKHSVEKEIAPVCGVTLDDGSSCATEPVQGNKRCLEHKGRKIGYFGPKSEKDKKHYYVHFPIVVYSVNQIIPPTEAGRIKAFAGKHVNRDCIIVCGLDLKDGSFCTRKPPVGRKRCEEHKGMRVKKANSRSFTKEFPSMFNSSGTKSCREENIGYIPSVFSKEFS